MNFNCIYLSSESGQNYLHFAFLFFSSQMIDPITEVAMGVPIYWRNLDLWLAGGCIIFNPLFWNIVSLLVYTVVRFSTLKVPLKCLSTVLYLYLLGLPS